MLHLITSLVRKRFCGSSGVHIYFLIRLKSFSSNLSSVQLNLVKVSVMYVLWFHTFHQVLFDMPQNVDVISSSLISTELHLKVHLCRYESLPISSSSHLLLLFEIHAPEIYEMLLYKHTKAIEYVKK